MMEERISWRRPLAAGLLVVFLMALGATLGALLFALFKGAVWGAVGGGTTGAVVAVGAIRWVIAGNGDLLHYPSNDPSGV